MGYRHQASSVGGIFISPGSEPVDTDTSPEAAARNVEALVQDLIEAGATVTGWEPNFSASNDDGRYSFFVTVNGAQREVDMPGIALEDVRFLGRGTLPEGDDRTIWDFPRIYVDGSSWIWYIGVQVLVDGD